MVDKYAYNGRIRQKSSIKIPLCSIQYRAFRRVIGGRLGAKKKFRKIDKVPRPCTTRRVEQLWNCLQLRKPLMHGAFPKE